MPESSGYKNQAQERINEINANIASNKKREEEERAREREEENKRQEEIRREQMRIENILNSQIGDKICMKQRWIENENLVNNFFNFLTGDDGVLVMTTYFFIDNKVNNRLQLRVAEISSDDDDDWATPKVRGIELKVDKIIWVTPSDLIDECCFWEKCY